MSYSPSRQQKRFKSDDGGDAMKPAPKLHTLIQDDYASKYKLARAKEFFIQGHSYGQVLGCGVEVHPSPSDNRFRVRVFDCYHKDRGNMKHYIEISWSSFEDIIRDKHHIIMCLVPQLREKRHIFHSNSFSVAVVPSKTNYHSPMVEFNKQGIKIYMDRSTFMNMMSFEETLRAEYTEHQRLRDEDKLLIDEIVNLMAYNRNEGRVNDFVKEPAHWYQAGTVTTWKKFTEQVTKSKERLKKRSRLSD